jgi:uncharacterized protein DUF2703
MKIEFLYFEGCPSYIPALNLLQKILSEEAVESPIEMIQVKSDTMAEALKFPGSPTIRINGKDIADTHKNTGYGQQCRVYEEEGILQGIPPEKLIRKAITENLIR